MQHLLNRLQLRDYRLIRAIYETGQLALAAEKLSLTQPAASRLLASIEQLTGTALFHRHPKGMTATPTGEIVAQGAAAILNSVEHTLRDASAIASGRSGSVRVGSVTGGAVAFVVPAIQKLKEAAKGADIYVDVAPSHDLVERLLNGEFDFVLARLPGETNTRQFNIRSGRPELIRFVVRVGHPLSLRKGLTLSDLASYEWILQPPNTPLRQSIDEAFVEQGLELPVETVITSSLLMTIAYLSTSDAIAPVASEVSELLRRETLGAPTTALDLADGSINVLPYHLISRRSHLMNPLANRLHELVFSLLSGDTPL
ncbi:LysR family transcriptional regulator [Rhizobium sp. L1K21]|uniref:LysR family transcriptional regulator n=1 Tax=Rhizobium sp. L1K21 TaxID=2954933 RepID=UPI002091FE87|nr:LysR family transcriptional regulator [Rhizobium sp. L1K21]MCO6188265.1 LysR family transcriptional regulator [Rhizobium sp. L1K21]